MLFSIIIPAYNYAKYLPRAIDSILAQSNEDYEIVIVNDGSTDGTADVIRKYQALSPSQIVYLSQENRGPSAARNAGIRHASGNYLLFLDADDELLPKALTMFQAAIEQQPHLDFIVGGREWISTDGKVKHRPAKPLSSSKEKNFRRLIRGKLGKLSTGCFIVHRRVFECIRFPEETRVGEDLVFRGHLIALFNGASFPTPVVRIWRHVDSLGHRSDIARLDRLKTVDLLLNPDLLSPSLLAMRTEILSLTQLAMFTFFYRQGHYSEAGLLYRQAIKNYPRHIFKWKHLRKYLSTLLRPGKNRPAS